MGTADESVRERQSQLIREGWAGDLAAVRSELEQTYNSAGKSAAEAGRDMGAWLRAVEDGNDAVAAKWIRTWETMRGESTLPTAQFASIGAASLTGETEESLAGLREAALETYAAAGEAATSWAGVTGAAVVDVRSEVSELLARLAELPAVKEMVLRLRVEGGELPDWLARDFAGSILEQGEAVRRDAGEAL